VLALKKSNLIKWACVLFLAGFTLMLLTKLPVLGLDQADFCGRCHAMDFQIDSYLHSSHRLEPSCGDCHDPQGLVSGSAYAAFTGTRDVYRVVTGTIPSEIKATAISKKVLQNNCLKCHEEILHYVGDTSMNGGHYCFDCHRGIVHAK
jgi:cytochrome c nitrite reductase small subunit